MIKNSDFKICFSVMTVLTILVGLFQSWGIALSMLNLCLISAVMAMGCVPLMSDVSPPTPAGSYRTTVHAHTDIACRYTHAPRWEYFFS